MDPVVIVSAVRTPIGKLGGALSSLNAVELGTIVAKEAIRRAQVSPKHIDQVIFGNVLQAGSGQNVARQIEINSGIPDTSTAMTTNQVCGSGLKAVRLGQTAIEMGDADVVLVGGTESMSAAPFIAPHVRFGHKYGQVPFFDSVEHDGLEDAFSKQPMGITAENVAEQFKVTREAQDAFALQSHQRAVQAQQNGAFNEEIVPVTIKTKRGSITVSEDEAVRPDTSIEALAKLPASFKKNGTVTAGNAAGLNDGASALVLMKASRAEQLGLTYLAKIDGYTEVGIDPAIMGYAPYYAINKLTAKLAISTEEIDRFEINEAFAAQSVAVVRDLKLDSKKVNANGGAIALGHPLGDSGARILTTLINQLHHDNLQTGIASLCIGGGMGMAMAVSKA
ncbi:acetyl-CoA acetyltransferase [Secundilactobacillus oryzae JCM 18671]|uniref:acetyl-CoA C-acetyltransferase n=1 Tax=Secundilactobacillus oryzae JCM 18671 TaxID=1291743 RepID=A0A081BHE5_9LACO|nr:acetyl-CoA C-acetyltransferase [Secundilactobacillus oryzae]GAK47463.1 acetyl-CoA acetyltransferase [Secundilactobacillus oryzae JCM 18671]